MPSLALFIFITLPWLNPCTAGPTPTVWPLLFSWLCVAVLLLALWRCDGGRCRRAIAGAWLAAGLLSCVIALLQYFGVAEVFTPWISQTQLGEAFGNLRQRNQFATLTNIALAALPWLAGRTVGAASFNSSSEREVLRAASLNQSVWPMWAVLGAAALLAVGNAASSSRTGLMQLGLLAALWLLWGGWRQVALRRVLLTALVVYGVATVALPLLAGLDLSTQGAFARLRAGDSLCASRLTLWSNVLHLIAQKPWLGWGWGWGELDYAHFITLYQGPRFCAILDNAHNLPLHLAVELGIPAAVAICGALSWLVWRAKPWRETDPVRQMAWGVLAVIGLHSLLEYPLWYGPFQMAVGLAVWLLCSGSGTFEATGSKLQPKFKPKRPFAHYLRALAAITMLAILGSVGISYHRVSQIYLAPAERSAAMRDNTLEKVRGSRFFHKQALFAELTLTPLTPGNAASVHAMALELLHYSPEPRVVEKLIESAVMLGRDDEALQYLARYRAAFPGDHAQWATRIAS